MGVFHLFDGEKMISVISIGTVCIDIEHNKEDKDCTKN